MNIVTRTIAPLDHRIPAWDMGYCIPRPCPVCGSETSQNHPAFIRPDTLRVLLCPQCKTFFVSPAPSSKQLSDFYQRYDATHRAGPKQTPYQFMKSMKSIDPFDDVRIRVLSTIMPLSNSLILDIGFGRPVMLHKLRVLGAIAHGIDPDPAAIEYARAMGIDTVYQGTIDTISLTNRYDAIFMNDIVEHLVDLHPVFTRVCELLKPGGHLLIWTPNGDTLHASGEPVALRVDLEHIQYFTKQTISYISRTYNLPIVHLESSGYPSLGWISKKTTGKVSFVKEWIKTIPGFTFIRKIAGKLKRSKSGDERRGNYHLFAIFRKPDLN